VKRALVLLIALQLWGWVRYLGRGLRTMRGALTALVGGGFFAAWMAAVLLTPDGGMRIAPDALRRNGPAFLLAYCLMNVFVSTGERAVYFSPGEVTFLFAGPFGRRGILGYKIVLTLLVSIPSTLIVAAVVRIHSNWFFAGYVALLLAILFQQLFGMAVNLIATSVGVRAYSRGRRLVVAAVLVVAALALYQAAGTPGPLRPRDLAMAASASPAWQAASAPLRWFFDAFLAERLWPDLALYAGLALLVDLALLGVVFALDAHYLESAAASSARIYAQIQRFRRGGLAAAGRGDAVPFRLPDFPYLGGVGPTVWRQLTTASRGMGRLIVVLLVVGALVVVPVLNPGEGGEARSTGAMLAGTVVWLSVFLTQLVRFDFRGDVDRMAALKALPVTAWRLALGQLLAPVLLVTAAQWATLASAAALRPRDGVLLLTFGAFAPPFNFLLFSLENFLFLRFPTRAMASSPGDFQAIGRNLLFMLAKLGALAAVTVAALAFGLAAWFGTRTVLAAAGHIVGPEGVLSAANAAGAFAAWCVVTVSGLALLPLVAWAFGAFDVGHDTPG
jgi:hypothetical protein